MSELPQGGSSKEQLLAQLKEQLEPDESVLWAEQIMPNRKLIAIYRTGALVACVLLIGLVACIFYSDRNPSLASYLIEVFLVLFAIKYAVDLLRPSQSPTRFAVLTNKRALEFDEGGVITVAWYSSNNFGNVEAKQTEIGSGTLLFATDPDNNRIGFSGVHNTAQAAEILFKLQDKKPEG